MARDPSPIDASDRAEIEQLLYAYAARIDAGDFDGVAALFARATLTTADGTTIATGADEVKALYESTTRRHDDGTPRTHHVTTNVIVEATGTDQAQARSYFTVLQQTSNVPLQPVIAGRYHDRLARDADGWHFVERRMMTDLVGDLHDHLLFDPALLEG